MARKRLNKKVALIGSALLAVSVIVVIYAILHFGQDAAKFVKDGHAALKAAREAADDEKRADEYQRAERSYQKAHRFARTDAEKIDVLFRLVDLYIDTDEWQKVLGCWAEIVRLHPKNVKARFGRLKYLYAMADSGARLAWQEVESQASELLDLAEDAGLLIEDTAQWDPFRKQQDSAASERLGPYLYLLKGRALLQRTQMGAFPDPDQPLQQAVDSLQKVRELEPDNIDAAWYLAQAILARGEIMASRGYFEERNKAGNDALELLQQVVDAAGDDPQAHINLLSMKLRVAERSSAGLTQEQVDAYEPEYVALVEKFPAKADTHAALARFYALTLKNLDKALMEIEKAVELDTENVAYAIDAAMWHYRKYSAFKQEAGIHKAIEMANNALAFPNAQDKPGPRYWANHTNRIALYTFLADCYIDQALELRQLKPEYQHQQWLEKAEQAVHEIEQLIGSGQATEVIKWQGMLELARGNENEAVRKMYAVYEQLKSVNQKDSLLSYRLARIFANTAELGAAAEFFMSALRWPRRFDAIRPDALLDYADLLLRLRDYGQTLNVAEFFERKYGPDERSWRARMNAYIGLGQFEDVEQELAGTDQNQPHIIKLKIALLQAKIAQIQTALARIQVRDKSPVIFQDVEVLGPKGPPESEGTADMMKAELESYHAALPELVQKLLPIEPNSVTEASIISVCNASYIAQGKTGEARALVDQFLEYFPESTGALFYRELLSEPDPTSITEQRRKQIEEHVLSNIADPVRRAINLGRHYHQYNELEKASAEFRKVFSLEDPQGSAVESDVTAEEDGDIAAQRRVAATFLLEIALVKKDWDLAAEIVQAARQQDLDDCGGHFFGARLAVARQQYEEALAQLAECLKRKPVFSYVLWLRSNVNAALGNQHASIEDARRAASLNPLDPTVSRALALILYRRNYELAANVSPDQVTETKTALRRAMSLNPRDSQLKSIYAEYLSDHEPEEALAVRQHLLEAAPTVENALLLGQMAMKVALAKPDGKIKNALLDIAASSFQRARALDPESTDALQAQAEYYRLTGQEDKAEQLLIQSHQQNLLWPHYVRSGKLEQARQVLERLHQTQPRDVDVVKGLLLVAERTGDGDAVRKYSEELLLLEDNADNRLLQIQAFLRTGLVKETEHKVQSFKEKHQDDERSLLLEAWLAMTKGQLQKALALTNQSLSLDQDNALAWRIRGQINLLMANYTQAVDDLKTSKSYAPEPLTRIALAKAYRRKDQVEEAIIELQSTIDDPQAPATAWILLEQVYLERARKTALRKFYDVTLAKFPDSPFWSNRAAAFAVSQGEFDRAEQLYKRAWEKTGTYTDDGTAALDGYLKALILGAGSPLTRQNWKPEKFDALFEEAGKHVNDDFAPVAYYRMAEAKMKLGDKETAVQYSQKALEKAFGATDEKFASQILNRTCSLLGNQEVERYAQQCLENQPDAVAANSMMASLAAKSGDHNRALAYIDKCLLIAGRDSQRAAGFAVKRATLLQLNYKKTSDNSYLERAVAEYESLLDKMPNNTVVLNNLAYILADTDRQKEALEYAGRAYEKMPNNPAFLDTYAYVLHKTGDNLKAAEFLHASLQQYELSKVSVPAEVYEHLGMVKEAVGAKAEAIAAYEQALEAGANELSGEAKEKIKEAIERLSR